MSLTIVPTSEDNEKKEKEEKKEEKDFRMVLTVMKNISYKDFSELQRNKP